MANIKGKQLTDSLSVTNVTGSNISASGLITGNSGSLQHIDVDNNAVVDGDLKVSQYIKHIGNETTFINFTSNRIRFKAGDVGFADMEKDASTPYPFTINQGGNRINFRVMDRNTDLVLKTDSEAFNVGLYHAGNKKLETTSAGIDVSNINVSASGHITASGNISSSATASFGELEIGNGGDIVLTEDQRIYFEADKATYIESHAADSFRVVVNDKQMFLLDEDTGDRAVFGNGTKVFIGANNNFTPSASLHIAGNLWVSGSDAQGGAHITASGNISASGDITANEFNGIFNGALSSSAQISTDISGSFFTPSASFSTRVTTAETELGNTLLSGSTQIADDISGSLSAAAIVGLGASIVSGSAQLSTDISGSFVAPSASFSTRITTAETELGNTILSSSAQISDDISGSLSAAAIVGLGAGIVSGSIDGTISSSAQIATDISGSFTAGFDFTGKISGSSTSTGSFGLIETDGDVNVSGRLAHAGDPDTRILFTDDDINITVGNVNMVDFTQDTVSEVTFNEAGADVDFRIESAGDSKAVFIDASKNTIQLGTAATTHVTASGNISGSRGSFLGFDSGSFNINLGVGTTTPAESLEVVGAISASTSGSFLNIDAPHIKATSVHGTILTATQGTIDHDSLANFVANEHIDHSGVTITAGDGLTGGGTIASTRTLAVGEGTGVTVNANDVAIGQDVATNANVTFASVNTTGNIVAQGDITAQNYIVSSSVTHMTSSFRSGSTISGDTPADDTHQFTGSLSISGSSTDITNTMTASLASIFLQNNGHISSSLGTIKGFSAIDGTTITGTTFTGVSGSFSENLGVNTTTPAEALEVVGSVSASASGSFLNANVKDNLEVEGKFTLPNITDVSASIASAVAGGDDMGNHTATQDLDMDGNDIFDVQHISGSGNISGSLGNILGYKSGSFQQLDANVVSASSVQATNLTGLVGTATQGTIDHDSLANFVANEHVDHTSITLTAGDGLSGGGTIAANRSFAVDATVLRTTGDSVISSSAQIATDVSGSFVAPSASFSTRITTAESELGNTLISSSAQLADDISGSFSTAAVVGLGAGIISGSSSNSSLTTAIVGEGAGILSGSAQIADDVSGSLSAAAIVGLGAGVISASAMVDHDSTTNFVANEHINHTSVSITAGDGLTGGGTIASTRTLAVGQGTGVTVNANDIAIGQAVETDSNVQFANITATATASLAKISGSLIESTGDFTLNSSGDIILDADGTDIVLKDGGTSFDSFKRASSDFIIKAETADKDILFKGTDDSTTITALQLDMSAGGNAQFLGNISGSQIEASGDVIAFGSSDRNLKDNIQPIENPLEKMDKIGGYTFVWNDKQSTYKGKDIGVVAQEIQEIMPEIVATRANGYLGVKYEKIVPLLIESIKELKKEVEDIKQKCDCLNK